MCGGRIRQNLLLNRTRKSRAVVLVTTAFFASLARRRIGFTPQRDCRRRRVFYFRLCLTRFIRSTKNSDSACSEFGNRFLTEFGRLSGSTRDWLEGGGEHLDLVDRREFIDALTKASSTAASQLLIAAHTAEPETLAKRTIELTN